LSRSNGSEENTGENSHGDGADMRTAVNKYRLLMMRLNEDYHCSYNPDKECGFNTNGQLMPDFSLEDESSYCLILEWFTKYPSKWIIRVPFSKAPKWPRIRVGAGRDRRFSVTIEARMA
jgi:hypothetical protein